MAKLYYQGHGSYRITAEDGRVIYVDPYAGDGYDKPADLILVTHQHGDHCQVGKITQKPGCVVISNEQALTVTGAGIKHNSFDIGGIGVEAVEAANKNHDPAQCVGYIITVDGVKIYASGDTSRTKQMETFADRHLDLALLPCDGVYNMDLEEASECAALIGARFSMPIHMKPGALFDMERAERFTAPHRLILEPGSELTLEGA